MDRWMDLLLKHFVRALVRKKVYGGPLRECDIDPAERWLAFRCLHCRSQIAEETIVEAETGVLLCAGCRGYVRQLTKSEIFGESWAAYIPSPYYRPWHKRAFKNFVEFLRRIV